VPEISILLVGDGDRSEFREAWSALQALGRVTGIVEAESAAAALAEGQVVADLIVVAQAFPGQFSHQAIDRLRRAAPLARVLGLLGSWCEGEMRTGKPWPGVIRSYWHQWVPRCDREVGRIRRGESSAWGLPATATEEERLLLAADCPAPKVKGEGRGVRGEGLAARGYPLSTIDYPLPMLAIYTGLAEMQDWLSAAFRCRGCTTVWLRPPTHSEGHMVCPPDREVRVEGAAVAIFDGSDCRGEELRQLEHLAATLRPAPTIALLDFPRIEDSNRALAAGAAAVVSKPLDLEDLFWHLDRLLQL
jgi:DNA-binding NarL/FixJ family response regulator